MHSFQPSRGRILFEVLCAVGIAASCGGAWMQTGASALLAAAAVATLYGLVHFFDLFRRNPAVAVEPQRIEFEPAVEVEPVPPRQEFSAPLVAVEPQLVVDNVVEEVRPAEEAEFIEPAPLPAKAGRRAKAPRKSGSRRAGAPKEPNVAELVPVAEPQVDVAAPLEMAEVAEPGPVEEPFHTSVAPLFEPEPYVRQQQRATFGRKAG
jgi:hypothetical protein